MAETVGTTLLLRFKQGDRQAVGTLLSRLRPYVRVIVRRNRGDELPGAADDSDLIQEVMMQAVGAAETFHGNSLGELICWLRTIALRTSRRELRHATGAVAPFSAADAGEHAVLDERDDPAAAASRHERAAQMAVALGRLPEDMRQVLLLRLVDGLGHAEIAQRMNRSAGSVRMLFLRAMERFREVCGTPDLWMCE